MEKQWIGVHDVRWAWSTDLLKSGLLFCTEKKKIAVSRPNVVSMYNRHMDGDDRLDENISL